MSPALPALPAPASPERRSPWELANTHGCVRTQRREIQHTLCFLTVLLSAQSPSKPQKKSPRENADMLHTLSLMPSKPTFFLNKKKKKS